MHHNDGSNNGSAAAARHGWPADEMAKIFRACSRPDVTSYAGLFDSKSMLGSRNEVCIF